jgi:hypothetical protein
LRPRFEELVTHEIGQNERFVSDDRPYVHEIELADYELFPALAQLTAPRYYRSWIRITTLLAVLAAVAVAATVLLGMGRARPPPLLAAYLGATGFAYMLCQVSFLGKLELFLGSPLHSMSLLLGGFLLTNGVGSVLLRRVADRVRMQWLAPCVGALALGSGAAMDLASQHWIGAPLMAKLLISAALIAPLGVALGAFYPYAVRWLTQRGHEGAIPASYGLSTLSSVAGATWALVAVVGSGYSALLSQAFWIYTALGAALLFVPRLRRLAF